MPDGHAACDPAKRLWRMVDRAEVLVVSDHVTMRFAAEVDSLLWGNRQ
jgi:hypothetical protein